MRRDAILVIVKQLSRFMHTQCAAKGGSVSERGLECLLKTAGPHTELKQEIPASGGRGGFGAAKGS